MVLGNVSKNIKLQPLIAARYMDELIIWTDQNQERTSNAERALSFYESAALQDSDNILIPYRQGVLRWYKGDWQQALAELAAVLSLATSQLLEGNQLSALQTAGLEPVSPLRQLVARAHLFIALCILGVNDLHWPRALASTKSALLLDPGLAEAHHQHSLLLFRGDRLEDSAWHLQRAQWLDPYRTATTGLLLINDYVGHGHVQYCNQVVFQHAKVQKQLWERGVATSSITGPHEEISEDKRGSVAGATSDSIGGDGVVHLIFCINPGRSGSHFLATALRTFEGVHHAFHEPMPQTQWHELTLQQPLLASYKERLHKVETIRKVLASGPPGATYSETSLNFITQFADVIVDEFRPPQFRISVIHLRRDLTRTLKSMIDVGWFDETMRKAGEQWDRWTHSLHSANAVLKPLATGEPLDKYDRAIGYILDIEARAQRLKERSPQLNIVEAFLEDINTPHGFDVFAQRLGLTPTNFTRFWVRQHTNAKSTSKAINEALDAKEHAEHPNQAAKHHHSTLAYCKQRIQQYIARCQQQGIELPPLPHFKDS